MDRNRNEYLGPNEERTSAMYFNVGIDGTRSHPQYYQHDRREPPTRKACGCSSMSEACNNCRMRMAEENWNSEKMHRTMDARNVLGQNTACTNADIANRTPYWHTDNPSILKEPSIGTKPMTLPHMGGNMPGQPNSLESNYNNYKSQPTQPLSQSQPQLNMTTSSIYSTERTPYDDKYSSKHELYVGAKARYSATPAATANAYNTGVQSHLGMEPTKSAITDHVINPSNFIAAKEHPSPNYARKCPQIFSPVEQSSGHPNLYMSTPQFSSDKFTNIHTQSKVIREPPQQDYRGLNNQPTMYVQSNLETSPVPTQSRPETLIIRESPVPTSSMPMPSYAAHNNNNKYRQMNEPLAQPHLQQHQQQQSSFGSIGGNTPTSRNVNYYPASSPKVNAPEMSPIIMKQSHTQYQYSKVPPPTSHLIPSKKASTDIFECRKKDDDVYDGVVSRNLYINPYNTPPSSDSCCKESPSPYAMSAMHRVDSPQSYCKYSMVGSEMIPANKKSVVNQSPTINRVSNTKSQAYYPDHQQIKYENNLHGVSPPNMSTIISSSPAASQNRIHHDYAPPANYGPAQPYQQYPPEKLQAASVKVYEARNIHQSDIYERQIQESTTITCTNSGKIRTVQPPMPQNIGSAQPAQIASPSHSSKKSQVPKPNYRELINEAFARKNATSEEELNLKIIKKTLNVDTQVIRTAPSLIAAPAMHSPMYQKYQTTLPYGGTHQATKNDSTSRKSYNCEMYKPKPMINAINTLPKLSVDVEEPKVSIKLEEKPTFSPLDLSMRTIKTKADSTEYKNKTLQQNSPAPYKYTLPRVNFTPNFNLNTAEQRSFVAKPPAASSAMLHSDCPTVYMSPPQDNCIPTSRACPEVTSMPSKSFKADIMIPTRKIIQMAEPGPPTNISRPDLIMVPKPAAFQAPAISHVDRSCASFVNQIRPSVLETNPYAFAKKMVKTEAKVMEPSTLQVDKLPPDTSIMPLPKMVFQKAGDNQMFVEQPAPVALPKSAYTEACERNPNYLGKKRHLQDLSILKYSETSPVKQPRYDETVLKCEYTSLPIVERAAEKLIQTEIPYYPAASSSNTTEISVATTICKTEPVTPTAEAQVLPVIPIKTEVNLLIAARIRTKAELKGFTFNPPIAAPASPPREAPKIKQEITQASEIPSIPELNDDFNQSSLLDFSWSKTCNSFVEQLLTNPKKKPAVTKKSIVIAKQEGSEEDQPMLSNDRDASNASIDVQCHKKDTPTRGRTEADEASSTTKPLSSEVVLTSTLIHKKISKLEREKMRLQQEKRIAARLQDESSSETDSELNKRKSERSKKPLKKGKARNHPFSDKNRFSDCGSDSSSDSDENNLPLSRNSKTICRKVEGTSLHKVESKKVSESDKPAEKELNTSKSGGDGDEKKASDSSKESPSSARNLLENRVNKAKTTSSCIKTKAVLSSVNKSKMHAKVVNRITRSKRKRELELQLANSKVLRNDKIIRNSTTKIKRKYVKKFADKQNTGKELSKCDVSAIIATRLRPKAAETVVAPRKKNRKLNSNQSNKSAKLKKPNAVRDLSLKEPQTDMFMEVYRYKRSLKVPPSLITIEHPKHHKIAASLPDLERMDTEEMSTFANRRNKAAKAMALNKANHSKGNSKPQEDNCAEEPRSIIDVLHSRVINSGTAPKTKAKKLTKSSEVCAAVHAFGETSQNIESNSVSRELPDSKLDADKEDDSAKKRHFSIFDTKVLQTKTRTESKLQQKKEIIREIFVGDDRPASAPPEMTQISNGGDKMTYEQKYEQFLQQLNTVSNEDTLRNFGRVRTLNTATVQTIKQEEDTESTSAIDADEKMDRDNQQDNMSVASGSVTLTNYRRRRPGKYLRRKGSSGFDYIRKKKKPVPLAATAVQTSHMVVKVERAEEYDKIKVKTESDVCREIQKWVLNKGVGQSTMHKAARLGYIDVIVYCLERMGMNPDQKDNAGYTPLHEACTNGWLDIARVLLQYGANHSEAAHSGIRPLHEASENDHEELVRLLLSYGADPLLATYAGQTPLMLASSTAMRDILNNYLSDIQNVGPDGKPWHFNGPWEIYDASECGCDIFENAPNSTCDMSRALRKSSLSHSIANKKKNIQYGETSSKTVMDECAVLLDNIDHFNSVRLFNDNKPEFLVENSDSEGEMFEFEEADVLLPPLYLLKDEGTEKWVLLSDLCNLLKVKSKDTLLNKIYPPSSVSSAHKSLMRELKTSDFLEKATCLQLLCAGEKINICASKVVLIKYNESVRNLLGVKTILMKF